MTEVTGILGGGVAGLALAGFMNTKSVILEKNSEVGGLCRSFNKNGLYYDIGPHIIFSKNSEVLSFINSISENNCLERSNQIFHKGKYIKYPFENFLAMLKNDQEISYCLNTFLNNPYEEMPAENMQAFFLKNFGEGISRLYLLPYNQKIWKFDPAMMDTQMVGRIPKPPKEHIISSAKGEFHEGYLHQLHFYYPQKGGAGSICTGLKTIAEKKAVIKTANSVNKIIKQKDKWKVITEKETFLFDRIVNCMPIHEFLPKLDSVPESVINAMGKLLFNSIYIVIVNVKSDTIGSNFTITIADPEVIFHRVNKLDFLGENYHLPQSSSIMLEVTFRQGDLYCAMKKEEIIEKCIKDMIKLGFIENETAVNWTDFHKEKYAYVIYDLNHRKNTDYVLGYLKSNKIESCGRFAEFEYLNSDRVIENAMKLANTLNSQKI